MEDPWAPTQIRLRLPPVVEGGRRPLRRRLRDCSSPEEEGCERDT
jgi:hypothetical protein